MTSLVRKIPDQISGLGVASSGQYQLQDDAYDYALAGMPFLSATQDSRPYTERMAEIRKQQFDNFAEPGEQSLAGWWLRSQSTFSGGAGVLYQDPDNDNQFNYRFDTSLGINPWISGEINLLHTMNQSEVSAATPTHVRGFINPSGVDAYWHSHGANLTVHTAGGAPSVVAGVVGTIYSITSSGATYYTAHSDGIKTGLNNATPASIYAVALASNAVLEFLKGRLILGHNNSVYQLVTAGAGALPTATYTHQDSLFRWKSITDGPTAIYVAGDSGTTSEIHKFTPSLNSGTGVPELTWAGVTATMPTGEFIRDIYQYVGSFVGIATTKGFRVGDIDSNGDIAYGPLLFEIDGGCKGIVGHDRFMWTGSTNQHDDASGVYRIDLGSAVQEQTTRAVRYAYARDAYTTETELPIADVAMMGGTDRVVFCVDSIGAFQQDESILVPSGYLTTGRIRFNTEEPKLYKFFSVRTPSPLEGDLSVSLIPESGGEIPYITYGPTFNPGAKDVGISTPSSPQNWVKFKFTLERGTPTTAGAVMNGWQVKVLPGSIRQRMISQVFQLFDEETDKTGQRIGYDGYARDRFEQFKAVARAGDVVLFQELAEGLLTSVVIDDWEFRQTGPPGPNRGALGGYLNVVLRTVAEST